MGREMTYKMLVRAINLETNQELAQLVSESFIVSVFVSFLPIHLASLLAAGHYMLLSILGSPLQLRQSGYLPAR